MVLAGQNKSAGKTVEARGHGGEDIGFLGEPGNEGGEWQ